MSIRDILPSLPDVTELPHGAVSHLVHYTAEGLSGVF